MRQSCADTLATEEPDELITHVRVCGGAGWVTIDSTRKPTGDSVGDKPPRPVVGTQAFRDPAAMTERLFQALGFRVDIEEVAHPDGRVLVFAIPSRPRGTAYHLDGAYLMRSRGSLVPMSEDQLRRIFAEGEPDWLEEHSKTGLNTQQLIELLDTQTFFELLKLPYPTDRVGVIDRLVQERLVDKVGSTYAIRRLGALLLAKRLAGC